MAKDVTHPFPLAGKFHFRSIFARDAFALDGEIGKFGKGE